MNININHIVQEKGKHFGYGFFSIVHNLWFNRYCSEKRKKFSLYNLCFGQYPEFVLYLNLIYNRIIPRLIIEFFHLNVLYFVYYNCNFPAHFHIKLMQLCKNFKHFIFTKLKSFTTCWKKEKQFSFKVVASFNKMKITVYTLCVKFPNILKNQ